MKRALILSLTFLLFISGSLALATPVSSAQSSAANTPQVQVPFYVYTGESFSMYVNNSGGFTNYTVTVYFSGDNLSGFSPTDTYHNFSATNPDFKIQINAPNVTQQMTFLVKASAQSPSGVQKFSSTYRVNVIDPIYLHAAVTNKNSVSMYNVTVNFYVDSNYIASKTISNISAGQTVTVNYTWLAPYLSNGRHTLEVQVNNTLLSINNGGSSVSSTFYYGHPPNYNWIYYVVAVVAIFMVVMTAGAGRRPKVGERRPKWRR